MSIKWNKRDVIAAINAAEMETEAQPGVSAKPSLADQIEGIVSRAPRPEIERRPEPMPPEPPE